MRLEKTYPIDGRGPAEMLQTMHKDGFHFDSTTCPVKLTHPSGWSVDEENRTITYWQERPDA